MSDAISSDVIQALADKLATFADGLDTDEREVLDRFFLQQVDDDVSGFSGDVEGAVRAAKQHQRDELQALNDDPPARRGRYESVLRKAMTDNEIAGRG